MWVKVSNKYHLKRDAWPHSFKMQSLKNKGVKNLSIKNITVCDGCDSILKSKSDIYKLSLRTDKFWNGVETDYLDKHLDFCYRYAVNIKASLEKISNQRGGSTE